MKTAGLLLCSALVLLGQPPQVSGIKREYMDPSASPCQDLYRFANGGWIKQAVIPPTEPRWGASEEVILRNDQALHDILEGLAHAKTPPTDHDARLLRTFYRSGMDLNGIEKAGLDPLKPLFRRIDRIRTRTQLVEEIGRLNAEGLGAAWLTYVDQDARDSASYALYLLQGGLALPDRSFYLRTDPASKEILQRYRGHLQAMFVLAGERPEQASR
ncbi:MAG TPA: M13 family metallopeptidase N-terminal domain-containing protein, partial [Holophagaceae bacterium]